jgi:peptidyl-prolyl cis-trans isomerase C
MTMPALTREPLLHFVLLGLLIWCVSDYGKERRERYTIHIGAAQREYLASTYLQQFGQPPETAQLARLIDGYVSDEIRLREGLALGLDRGDEIVRRRIIQKYDFLRSDLAVPGEPTPAELGRWFEKNRMRYQIPERVSFAQVYFASPDHRPLSTVPERALQALAQLRKAHASRAEGVGDPFPGPSDVGALTKDDAVRMFGQSEVSEGLFSVPIEQWTGPLRSGYGWHLLYVTHRLAARVPALEEVRGRVLADYLADQREAINAGQFRALKARYTITWDGPN